MNGRRAIDRMAKTKTLFETALAGKKTGRVVMDLSDMVRRAKLECAYPASLMIALLARGGRKTTILRGTGVLNTT